MRFGLFYEHQLPRPWDQGPEEKLLADALEQLADQAAFDSVEGGVLPAGARAGPVLP